MSNFDNTSVWFDADQPAGVVHAASPAITDLEQEALDHLEECINAARSVY